MNSTCVLYFGDERVSSNCGYCHGDGGSFSIAMWSYRIRCEDYQNLIDSGWRRSGNYIYKPRHTETCCPLYTIRCNTQTMLQTPVSKTHKQVIRKMAHYLKYGRIVNKVKVAADSDVDTVTPETAVSQTEEVGKGPAGDVLVSDSPVERVTKKSTPRPGAGADPSKKKCTSARQQRIAKANLKKSSRAAGGQQNDEAVKRNHVPQQKYLKDIFAELNNDPANKHKLEIRTVKANLEHAEFREKMDECYKIYRKYQVQIHHDKLDDVNMTNYTRFLVDNTLFSSDRNFDDNPDIVPANENIGIVSGDIQKGKYGAYHQIYMIDGVVIAVGVLDVLPRCTSSVYFYYDPEYSFLSLGTFSSLRELLWTDSLKAEHENIKYYYMGFYIHTCPKMRYKAKYAGSSLLCCETLTWVDIESCLKKLDGNKYSRFAELDIDDTVTDITDLTPLYDKINILVDVLPTRTLRGYLEYLEATMESYNKPVETRRDEFLLDMKNFVNGVGLDNAIHLVYVIFGGCNRLR